MEMELLGQLNQPSEPTRNPPPPTESGSTFSPSTVNDMVIGSSSERAVINFALFLLVVAMGTFLKTQAQNA